MNKLIWVLLLLCTFSYSRAQTSFTGLIKYRMTTDDPADHDSMFMIFSDKQIRFIQFIPGPRGLGVDSTSMIANFENNTLITLDYRKKKYRVDSLFRNPDEIAFSLSITKKTGHIIGNICQEFSGEMNDKNGDKYEVACLVSSKHPYEGVLDYYFLNVHPVIMANKIVLGFRNKSSDGENTYIMAYQIIPGKMDSYFDLSAYQSK